ncbi:MAG TPA: DUF4139 domain-containing protein, partial [Sulfurovum sp.]|nr:DUF4139 domain-containing protein [Sulfurovum sp.]
GNPMALVQKTECPENERLCKAYNGIIDDTLRLNELTANIKTLEQILSMHKINTLDASSILRVAREVSKEKAALDMQAKLAQMQLELQETGLKKQTDAMLPLFYGKQCESPVKLVFGYGMIGFEGYYEADISNKDKIKVTQYLSVSNHSGIDIKADEATFFYRQASQDIRPVHFSPWIVSEYQPPIPDPRKAMAALKASNAEDIIEPSVTMAMPEVSKVYYNDAREYGINGLTLPSTGIPVNVPVVSWSVPMTCDLQLHAYINTDVYEVCTFVPDKQIESNDWKIKKGDETLNSNAKGEYADQKYVLYTKIDPDIHVIRKPIVQKEGDTGFFGSPVRKKDGYILELVNKSDKVKKIQVTERIPTSTTEKIEVKLLSVNTEYKMLKDGRINMEMTLGSKESKKVEVIFEVSYDKEMQIRY